MSEIICPLCKKDCREPYTEDDYGELPFCVHWFGELPFSRMCEHAPHARMPSADEECWLCHKLIEPGCNGYWIFGAEEGPMPSHHGCFVDMFKAKP